MSKEFQWTIRGNILYRATVGSIDFHKGYITMPISVFRDCYKHIETIQVYDTESKVFYTAPKELFVNFVDEEDIEGSGWFAMPLGQFISSATPRQVIKDTDLFKAADYVEVK